MLCLASGASPRRSGEGYEKANCRLAHALAGAWTCQPTVGQARLSNESRASVDSPPAPICPSTSEDGTCLGSPGSPLGTSLPTDLRPQSWSSRYQGWELCYIPRPPPSDSRPWWNSPVQPAINARPPPFLGGLSFLR